MTEPRVLSEAGLPIAAIGAESKRERGASSALPPIYFLHVWWARRPLMTSRASVLAATLPTWSPEWRDDLLERFPTDEHYRKWFLAHLGVTGDPATARKRIQAANEAGIKLEKAYEGRRAFTVTPDADGFAIQRRLLEVAWGTADVTVADPMAGGGSIPFESLRFGYRTLANELNPVASVLLMATLKYPAEFGPVLAADIRHWGGIWAARVRERLEPFFPRRKGESIRAYLFARTVADRETGKPVPLAPNWWLRRGSNPVALKLIADPTDDTCRFEIVRGKKAVEAVRPDEGTVSRGDARSPWSDAVLTSDYIKAEAQAGRMGEQLYALAVKGGDGADFRAPNEEDLGAVIAAEDELRRRWDEWERAGLIPTEEIPMGSKTREPRGMGMSRWCDLFSPRQLLSRLIAIEELRALEEEMSAIRADRAKAVLTYLGLAFDKAADYNSRMSVWHTARERVTNTFSQHNLAFKYSPSEMDSGTNLFPWVVGQVAKSFQQLAELIEPSRGAMYPSHPEQTADLVSITQGSASDLPWESGSVHAIVVDPPYYDNVQYAELSDFFYVWQKRSLGHLYPELFGSELTDKESEAVANPGRFEAIDKKNAKELARADYERKMTACFREMHRVLRDDGVLTVMFTHKRVEAWDALGRSLIEAGFAIGSSWPVHTESEHSLHQAKKAAASSTILLTCRKRTASGESSWWDDLKQEVRRTARKKAEDFQADGIAGVDLYISTFGPTLSVISTRWPVLTSEVDPETGEPQLLRPEEALDLAREEVASLRRQGLLLGRTVQFDPITDFYLLAWDAFKAVEFPYDEARKLALALGVDVEGDLIGARLVSKKADTVTLQLPRDRRRTGLADPEASSFVRQIDAAHALMVAYQEDGTRGAEAFLKRTRLASDASFVALLQGLLEAIPRTKAKGLFVRPEAAALDGIALLIPDLQVPEEPEVELGPEAVPFPEMAEGDEEEE